MADVTHVTKMRVREAGLGAMRCGGGMVLIQPKLTPLICEAEIQRAGKRGRMRTTRRTMLHGLAAVAGLSTLRPVLAGRDDAIITRPMPSADDALPVV